MAANTISMYFKVDVSAVKTAGEWHSVFPEGSLSISGTAGME